VSERARFSVRPALERPAPRGGPGLIAGAAEVDITPPPGLPKAGYSANAHDGNGFHTRLRARVLYLDDGTTPLALVACDLLGGSSVLQHRVAEAVAATTRVRLPGLFIGATHTHAGPGQFLGTDFYNRFASNRSGFDPGWVDFLVERISGAVTEAVTGAGPASLAIGTADVWGSTRNRSHPAHVENETVADKRTEPQRKWSAVNPELHVIRADRVDGDAPRPLAAFAVFSIHGTGVPQRTHSYNADVWAYLTGELDRRIEASAGARAVVGAVEGTHADVAPALRPGMAGHVEARRIGRTIGAAAHELWASLAQDLRTDVELGAGLREVDLDRSRRIGEIELPRRGAVGAALVAGATENTTPVLDKLPPFTPGHPRRWGRPGPQGAKWVIGSRWLQPLVVPPRSMPRIIPVQVLRLADTALIGLPFEITVESGRRIAAAAWAALDESAAGRGGVDRVVVSSVANEYCGHVATAEEYGQQWYEGGHTLYGPRTQAFLAAHAAEVAHHTLAHGWFHDVAASRSWDLKVRRFLPSPVAPPEVPPAQPDGKPTFTDPAPTVDGHWSFEWIGGPPTTLCWHRTMVSVEASDDDGTTWRPAIADGRPVDDQGWDVEVTHLGDASPPGRHRYRARWFNPDLRAGRVHRFIVATGGGASLSSPAFD
jgi:neutral ceramidase